MKLRVGGAVLLTVLLLTLSACDGGSPNSHSTAATPETITVTVPLWDIAKAVQYWNSSGGVTTAQGVWRAALCDSSEPTPREVATNSTSITYQVHLSSREVTAIKNAIAHSSLCSGYSIRQTYEVVFNAESYTGLTTTTTSPPVPSTTSPPASTTTTTDQAAGYFNVADVEGYLNGIAVTQQGDEMTWSSGEASTDDGVCTFTLTNSEGESASLADSIVVSCGPPSISDTLSEADVHEATPYLIGIVNDIGGQPATSWLMQQISSAGSGSGLVAEKLFGSVAVDVNFGDGQLSETLLWQG